ncbi:serine hydrolase domain-containing protein [Ilumatobacter sp.]|uniref:serine hydrolase domain-containing protein n=1 Tax=Ilumatobacter sp. TaxID=1967498 RepID=UPI003B52FCE1
MATSIATAALDEMFSRPDEHGVSLAFVARRGGEVVEQRYATAPAGAPGGRSDVTAETTLVSWSMAKSITHALVGILVGDGLIEVAAPAPVPEWAGTPKEAITLQHLLEMRSGLRFVEDYVDGDASHCIEMLFGGTDPSFGHYAAMLDLEHPPGERFSYSSGTTNIVCRIVGDVLSGGSTDPDERRAAVDDVLRRRLFGPVGMSSATAKYDDAGDFVGSSFVYATADDFARFGELYLHDGVTLAGRGERILPEGWAEHGRTPTAHDDDSGFDHGRHFWSWPGFPGSFACHGYQGQYTLVLPDRDLVVVHLGVTDIAHQPGLRTFLTRIAEVL